VVSTSGVCLCVCAVPILSISGSDMQEMFVGVGPARVR